MRDDVMSQNVSIHTDQQQFICFNLLNLLNVRFKHSKRISIFLNTSALIRNNCYLGAKTKILSENRFYML